MTVYAIGDVHGCFYELDKLLDKISFHPGSDKLCFTGDLVNRGGYSLAVLRLLEGLGDSIISVLGNHDLHLIAVAYGATSIRRNDNFLDVLAASDRIKLIEWLRHRPIMYHDDIFNISIVHAGINPIWNLDKALEYANTMQNMLRSDKAYEYLERMYDNTHLYYSIELNEYEVFNVLSNYFTRMRFTDITGCLDLKSKEGPDKAPVGFYPWYANPNRIIENNKIIFGHWAALEGAFIDDNTFAIDTGCAWGGSLSALRLDTFARISVAATIENAIWCP